MRENGWKRFLRLSAADRVLFLEGAALVGALVACFRIVGVRRACAIVQRLVARSHPAARGVDGAERARHVTRLVGAAARRIPGSRCLDRSVATTVLLRSEGISVELVLGVRRSATNTLEAHAWVEMDGSPLGETGPLDSFASFEVDRVRDGLLAQRCPPDP